MESPELVLFAKLTEEPLAEHLWCCQKLKKAHLIQYSPRQPFSGQPSLLLRFGLLPMLPLGSSRNSLISQMSNTAPLSCRCSTVGGFLHTRRPQAAFCTLTHGHYWCYVYCNKEVNRKHLQVVWPTVILIEWDWNKVPRASPMASQTAAEMIMVWRSKARQTSSDIIYRFAVMQEKIYFSFLFYFILTLYDKQFGKWMDVFF